jgi:hypothetical protein
VTRRTVGLVVACSLSIAAGVVTPWPATIVTAQQSDTIPDLAGLWVQIDPVGLGRGGLNAQGRAMVRPGAADMVRARIVPGPRGGGAPRAVDEGKPNPPGVPYVTTDGIPQTCMFMSSNMQFLTSHSAAKHLIQDKNEVIIAGEMPSIRRIFMNEKLPDPATLRPDGFGYSVGRYENGELIVETVGMAYGAAPRGGFVRPETKLIERFRLTQGGQRILLTWTWDDPVIYEKPHSYELVWQRQGDTDYAMEEWCDPSDPELQRSITPPPQ